MVSHTKLVQNPLNLTGQVPVNRETDLILVVVVVVVVVVDSSRRIDNVKPTDHKTVTKEMIVVDLTGKRKSLAGKCAHIHSNLSNIICMAGITSLIHISVALLIFGWQHMCLF